MNSKDLIKQLEQVGWQEVRVKGSHHHFRHPNYSNLLTVDRHNTRRIAMLYPVAIEKGTSTEAFGVVFPDVQGCYSAGDSFSKHY